MSGPDRGAFPDASLFARATADAVARLLFPAPAACLLVALSGGPDSCALLLALREAADHGLLPPGVRIAGAAHFHHGLRGADADADAAFSAALCARLGLFCVVGLGNARPARGQSPHDAARRARYAFLRDAARDLGADTLLTAHTADDRAETVLLRVLRGASVDGLAGIPPRRDLGGGLTVLRPLLGASRAAVEAYCALRGIAPRRDPSNEKDRYARPRLRRHLPDLAAAFNPRLPDALNRLADHAARDADLLGSLAADLWRASAAFTAPGVARLSVAPLAAAHPALRRRVLLRALRLACPDADAAEEAATAAWVDALEELVTMAAGGTLNLPGPVRVVCDGRTLLLAAPPAEPPPAPYAVPLAAPGRTRVAAAGLWLTVRRRSPDEPPAHARRAAFIDAVFASSADGPRGTILADPPPLVARDARSGDRLAPLGMGGRTRLTRDLMAEAGWPERERAGTPLVVRADTGEPLWLVGLAQGEATRVPADASAVWRLSVEWEC